MITSYLADGPRSTAFDDLSIFMVGLMTFDGQPVPVENVRQGDIIGLIDHVPMPGDTALFFPVDFCEKTPFGWFVRFAGWGRELTYSETEEHA